MTYELYLSKAVVKNTTPKNIQNTKKKKSSEKCRAEENNEIKTGRMRRRAKNKKTQCKQMYFMVKK